MEVFKMRKWNKVALSATAVLSLTTLLTACGNKQNSSNGGKTVVSMYMPGDKPKNYSAMIKRVNKELAKKYPDVQLSMKFIGWGDYQQKYNVMVTSGDKYDLAFAQNYAVNAQKGAYADMTQLIKKYASKAYKGVDPAYWKGVKVNGKIYGFPVNGNVYANNAITFNKAYLDKYNIKPGNIKTYADATSAMAKFHAAKPNVAAFAIGQGFKASPRHMDFLLGNGLPFAVDSTGKSTKVFNAYDQPEMQSILKTLHEWYQKGYIPKDAATSNTQYNLQDNTWFSRQETQGPFDYGDTALENASGGKKMVSYAITDSLKSEAQAQVAIWSISKTSQHKKEAMEVLNALNTDPKLLNNITWGLEGQQWHFTDKAKGKIKTTSKYQPGYFIGAWMMGNNDLLYTQNTLSQKKIDQRKESIKKAKEANDLGFIPDTTQYKTEVTNCSNVMSKYLDILNTGTADPVPTIKKMDKELKTAGYDKIQAGLQKQYDKFLAQK